MAASAILSPEKIILYFYKLIIGNNQTRRLLVLREFAALDLVLEAADLWDLDWLRDDVYGRCI